MPKLTWMAPPKQRILYLAALLSAYKKAGEMTSAQIGAKLGCSPENVRSHLRKPAEKWNVGLLIRYCDILGVPYREAMEAVVKEVKQEQRSANISSHRKK